MSTSGNAPTSPLPPDCVLDIPAMLVRYDLLFASVLAALVALLGHWLMALGDRRRRARRVFAESIHQCCEELEDAAIHYWAGGGDEKDALILAAKMKAALMKMIRFINADAPVVKRVVAEEEREELVSRWSEAQETATAGEFETCDRVANPKQVALVVGKITAIRAKIAGMRAE